MHLTPDTMHLTPLYLRGRLRHYRMRLSIALAGAEYCGIQEGYPKHNIPDLVLFTDPITRTTLALEWCDIGVLSIARRIAAARARWRETHS